MPKSPELKYLHDRLESSNLTELSKEIGISIDKLKYYLSGGHGLKYIDAQNHIRSWYEKNNKNPKTLIEIFEENKLFDQ